MNSPLYQESRQMMYDLEAYKNTIKGRVRQQRSRCETCLHRPKPQIGLGAIHGYLFTVSDGHLASLSDDMKTSLWDWSEHVTFPAT
jgi:hypothetical protein